MAETKSNALFAWPIIRQAKIVKFCFITCLTALLIGLFLLPKVASAAAITAESIIDLTNQARTKNNAAPLTANQYLAQAAYNKGLAIIEAQQFDHNIDGKIFSYWIRQAGYNYSYVGENLAIDFVTSQGAIKAWLDSPSHRKNLLNQEFKETGVAVIKAPFQNQDTILIVQIFGRPAPVATPAISPTVPDQTSALPLPQTEPEILAPHNLPDPFSASVLASLERPALITGIGEQLMINKQTLPALGSGLNQINSFRDNLNHNYLLPLFSYLVLIFYLGAIILIAFLLNFILANLNKLFKLLRHEFNL